MLAGGDEVVVMTPLARSLSKIPDFKPLAGEEVVVSTPGIDATVGATQPLEAKLDCRLVAAVLPLESLASLLRSTAV